MSKTTTGAITQQALLLDEEPAPAQPKARTTRVRPRRRRHRMLRTASARLALEGFDEGHDLLAMTGGEFSLLDAILVILEKTGPANVTVCTYSTGLYDAEVLAHFLQTDRIRSMRWILDGNFRTLASSRGYAVELMDVFGQEAIRTTRVHAKFVLIEADGLDVVITSSANLNENKRLEHFMVTTAPETAAFFREFVATVWGDVKPGWNPDHGVPGLKGLDPTHTPIRTGTATTGEPTIGIAHGGPRHLGIH